jgi:hypothetical protein
MMAAPIPAPSYPIFETGRNVSRDQRPDSAVPQPPRPTRAQRLAVAGFLIAFGLTILTLLFTAFYPRLVGVRDASKPAHEAATQR